MEPFCEPGRTVPLDLDLELENRYVKEACKKLGKNLSHVPWRELAIPLELTAISLKSLTKIRARSGKHSHRSGQKDLETLIDSLMKEDSMNKTPGRKYKHFPNFTGDMEMSSLYCWITNHKNQV